MVIFGTAGELTKRLVVPAPYNLANDHQLSEEFVVGADMSAAQ
jgi:glucose-6-phosphate 1-dehydrogenase